ncbi:hypothetical protein K443DRAFT_679603 [Laccaria amethystina LaAM-08-1]|uniref:Uncharacterized protein n=1 Tax=Laccaria amethystina LaAM-08-1 TaxID=1095629 RepID=A0A0C9XVB5_9AGAR|nr:hypothetical protein K443DRAFT_679603 [Laccaria amethystina LaAM-08-1]
MGDPCFVVVISAKVKCILKRWFNSKIKGKNESDNSNLISPPGYNYRGVPENKALGDKTNEKKKKEEKTKKGEEKKRPKEPPKPQKVK